MTSQEVNETALLIKKLTEKQTVLVIDHDMSFVEKLEGTVSVLHMGSLIKEGDIQTIRQDPEVIRSISDGRGRRSMLVLKKVNAKYGMSQVLWDLDMEVNTGEGVALLGRNGAGKTTLLRTIMGLHPAASGKIEFFSSDITGLPAFERARLGIAYVPAGARHFPHLTGKENLLMGWRRSIRKNR